MIKTSDICFQKFSVMWHAYHPNVKNTIGIGSSQDDAIKDFRKQVQKKFRDLYIHRFTYGAGESGQ